MRHFPVFVDTRGQRIVMAGGGLAAVAKLRLLLKTEAAIEVYAPHAGDDVRGLAADGRIALRPHALQAADVRGATLVYCANEDAAEDARVAALAVEAGVLANIVDNLEGSRFITPAIVDRDPVTVAIGTEGTAPVLARQLKARIESQLGSNLGHLARAAAALRGRVARLPSTLRRRFWRAWFARDAEGALPDADTLLREVTTGKSTGRVLLVGAGPGNPELLTGAACRALREADVVLYDRLVDARVLEIARREALQVEVGKSPGGASWSQDAINAEMVRHARDGATVVRLKSGDPMLFGRADEELDALDAAGVECQVIAGVSSAVAASARLKASLTRRGRNGEVTFATAHDVAGYAEGEWKSRAKPGAVTAFYMGVRAARFVQGRLLLHGAGPGTPVTVVENASRDDERVLHGELDSLDALLETHAVRGPAIIFTGLAPRTGVASLGLRAPDLRSAV